jgi:hypothetical protein
MDLLDEWLAEQQTRSETHEEKHDVYQKPRCAVCAGRAPDATEAMEEYQGIQEEELWFRYAPAVQTEFRRVAGAIPQAHRLTDSKSGIVIELHHCFDEERLVFQVRGGMPQTESEKVHLESLLRYAFRLRETRGRKAGQIDTTPRRRRRTTSADDHKAKILAAISELRKEPIYRKDVARVIGIREATLRDWIKEIGEEWDALISEALPRLE